jgi:hypothetical protein
MADELWMKGILVAYIMGIYWDMWRQRTPSAKKNYLLISFIGFLMCFAVFAFWSLPEPLATLALVTAIAGVILAPVFMHKYYKSLHPKE